MDTTICTVFQFISVSLYCIIEKSCRTTWSSKSFSKICCRESDKTPRTRPIKKLLCLGDSRKGSQ